MRRFFLPMSPMVGVLGATRAAGDVVMPIMCAADHPSPRNSKVVMVERITAAINPEAGSRYFRSLAVS